MSFSPITRQRDKYLIKTSDFILKLFAAIKPDQSNLSRLRARRVSGREAGQAASIAASLYLLKQTQKLPLVRLS